MTADRPTLVRALVAVLVLAASGGVGALFVTRQDVDPPSKTYQVELRDGTISGPTRIRDRRANVRVLNSGEVAHELQIVRLAADAGPLGSLDAWPAATFPAWATPVGGIAHLEPGTSATVHIDPGAGAYAFVCRLPSPSGASYASEGMAQPFRVSGT